MTNIIAEMSITVMSMRNNGGVTVSNQYTEFMREHTREGVTITAEPHIDRIVITARKSIPPMVPETVTVIDSRIDDRISRIENRFDTLCEKLIQDRRTTDRRIDSVRDDFEGLADELIEAIRNITPEPVETIPAVDDAVAQIERELEMMERPVIPAKTKKGWFK